MADFGEILRNIGEFGLFQQLTLIALCSPNFIQSFVFASFIFIQSDPERHCNTDWILQADSNLTTDEQLNLTLPREEDGTFSRCRMFVPVDWDIGAIREYALNETTGCQNGWVYSNMLYEATIVTDFDLVCDKAKLVEVIQAMFMAGILVGSLIFGPCAESFIPESARWLLNRGRTEEAKQLIVKAAAINKRTVPDSLLDNIAVKDVGNKGGIKVIFRSPVLTKYFFLITLAWFSVNLSLHCLYFNMGNLGLNIFVTQFLFGAIEIPAHILCMWLLEVFGRKLLLGTTLLTAGLCCMLILAVPQGHATAVTSLAVISRFFLVWASSICNVFVQELFPTSVRQTATALGAMSGRTGGLLAPLLNMLAMYHWVIPITVFSSLTLVSGALSFLLPETRRKELPESADEAENNRNGTSTNTDSWSNATKL
ncbi:solute carrier family 22 member 13-like [Siniperca chuatsi]|uniref:solute carrier family 22 member 13-like n=1 Tax=Siniperca chuatsi TaxID=119488 RepID=UPI001CE0CEB4|nr:solute carrier family 22 member 13-like [Siniperca chuatsi]